MNPRRVAKLIPMHTKLAKGLRHLIAPVPGVLAIHLQTTWTEGVFFARVWTVLTDTDEKTRRRVYAREGLVLDRFPGVSFDFRTSGPKRIPGGKWERVFLKSSVNAPPLDRSGRVREPHEDDQPDPRGRS